MGPVYAEQFFPLSFRRDSRLREPRAFSEREYSDYGDPLNALATCSAETDDVDELADVISSK